MLPHSPAYDPPNALSITYSNIHCLLINLLLNQQLPDPGFLNHLLQTTVSFHHHIASLMVLLFMDHLWARLYQ
ncbi:hypothetical protein XELAEV_18036449mg [Xenopus laevis]|uniref:Uncharacterized protein n=1 Tax=Xenopus laevis TaxID=8355 RepID=A0A974HD19_XENLA|nr:hypothetical protein XELAEV_18036449mg [Xenopus laevis]